ncbi:MAG: alpha/beta hydrolase [Pseudomonadota bacterium]
MQVVAAVVTRGEAGQMIDGRGTMDGPAGLLETLVEQPHGADRGADLVICHPHPLHGGTLDNKVVHTLARAARDEGLRAVRFNFRGTGRSTGIHDHGRGETDDLLAVVAAARGDRPGSRLLLAGFSFGAFVTASSLTRLASAGDLPLAALLVAPPVHYAGFDDLPPFPLPVTVFQGDDDEVVEPEAVAAWCAARRPPLVPAMFAAGHFFHGALPELKERTAAWIRQSLLSGGGRER